MASASGKALRDLRNLKTEESALLEVINDLKNQLNRLKVEELSVISKIRQRRMNECEPNDSAASRPENDDRLSQVFQENPDLVNKVDLNLSTAGTILNKLAVGGAPDSSDQEEYEEDDSEEIDEASLYLM